MITVQVLYNILGNKISSEMQKAIIRNNCPPQIAECMCAAIDGQERAERFQRLLQEYNEWLINQQRQQSMVQQLATPSSVVTRPLPNEFGWHSLLPRFLREYYG